MQHSSLSGFVSELRRRAVALMTVESCTGGLIADQLTNEPGASEIYLGGFQVYCDAMKSRLLDVDPEVLKTSGAVSAQTAALLAENGLLRAFDLLQASSLLINSIDLKNLKKLICVSTTGIAGPGGGSDLKPVGLCFIGIASMNLKSSSFKGTSQTAQVEKVMGPAGLTRRQYKELFSQTALAMVLSCAQA